MAVTGKDAELLKGGNEEKTPAERAEIANQAPNKAISEGSGTVDGKSIWKMRGSMKDGGPVHETGAYLLHEGEHVVPKKEANMAGEKKHNVSLYRSMHHLRKGGLHRALGISEGENIPADKLEVHEGDSTHMKHMKNFAKTMKGFKK